MKAKLLIAGMLLFAVQTVSSQTKTLTNASIIKLAKAGMDNDIILSKIQTSVAKFDVTDDGLISLKNAGVSNEVIKAMIDKNEGVVTKNTETPQPKKLPMPKIPTNLNEINYLDSSRNNLVILEKTRANISTKVMGMGSTNFEAPGEMSSIRISNASPVFVVSLTEAMGDPTGWFTLYKATGKKNKRSVPWVKAMGTGVSTKEVISYQVRKIGAGAFEMTPSIKLEKGEYFFLAKGTLVNYGSRAADVFAFGVD